MKEKHVHGWVGSLIVLGLCYAWLCRHSLDDAFITFRYSQHLAEGIGPVWNADQRVEGYTNFLWMVLMAVPIKLGLDPVLPANLISLVFLSINFWLIYCIVLREVGKPLTALWIWLPVVCSHTLLLFATSGLETAMNGCIWTIALWQLQANLHGTTPIGTKSIWLLGLTVALSIMSRPEGGLLAFACMCALWIHMRRNGTKPDKWLLHFCLALGLLTVPWLVWKYAYYGDLFPNTFHVKALHGSLVSGIKYGMLFVLVSGIWLAVIFRIGTKRTSRSPLGLFLVASGLLAIGFLLYTIVAGGDYLEFRLLTPVIPVILIWPLLYLAHRSVATWRLRATAMCMCALAFIWGQGHGRWFKIWQMDSAVHTRDSDAQFMTFVDQGKALGDLLDHDPSIRMAIGACGAIPYYTAFYGIDLYGLNESNNEFESYATGFGPGHAQLGNFRFIERKAPHLISLRCAYLTDDAPARNYDFTDPQIAEIVKGFEADAIKKQLKILELPLGNGFVEVCIYWKTHPRIDNLIKNNSLKIYMLRENE